MTTLLNQDGSINLEEMQKRADDMKAERKLREETEHSVDLANRINNKMYSTLGYIKTSWFYQKIISNFEYTSDMEKDATAFALYSYLYEIDGMSWEHIDRDTIDGVLSTVSTYFDNISYDAEHRVFFSSLSGSSSLLEHCISKQIKKDLEKNSTKFQRVVNFIKHLIATFKDNHRLKKLGLARKEYF